MKIAKLLSLFVAGTLVTTARSEVKVGDDAPNFTMQGTDGKTYKLSDFKGKQAVVLAWFPKAKTPGCTLECKSFREHGKGLRDYDVAYFTASCDTPEYNKEFSDSLTLDFPILSDPDKSMAQAYGVVHEGRPVPEALDLLHRQGWQDPVHRQGSEDRGPWQGCRREAGRAEGGEEIVASGQNRTGRRLAAAGA